MAIQEILDITKIQTIEDLNAIDFNKYVEDFNKYVDSQSPIRVKYIIYPNTSEQLNRICKLSNEAGSKVKLNWSISNYWSIGDLYYRIRTLPQIMANKTIQKILDITKIRTIEDLNSTKFSEYIDSKHKSWVRHINNPVAQDDLNRVCNLSDEVGAKINLGWSMGELFYNVRALPQIKALKQVPLFDDKIFGLT